MHFSGCKILLQEYAEQSYFNLDDGGIQINFACELSKIHLDDCEIDHPQHSQAHKKIAQIESHMAGFLDNLKLRSEDMKGIYNAHPENPCPRLHIILVSPITKQDTSLKEEATSSQ